MTSSQNWFMGLAPHTPMEHAQAATEAMYAAEDERDWRARFEEAPETMIGVYFYPRMKHGSNPAGVTVSKRDALPAGDFGLTEYVWGAVSLWFVDVDEFTADERQDSYEAFIREQRSAAGPAGAGSAAAERKD